MAKTEKFFDITIVGGGLSGLTCAQALADDGYSIAVFLGYDPKVTSPQSDNRSTAIMTGFHHQLSSIGIDVKQIKNGAPLKVLRLCKAESCIDYSGQELGHDYLAWNCPNGEMKKSILEHLKTLDNVTLYTDPVDHMTQTPTQVKVQTKKVTVTTSLLIGADGHRSIIREKMGAQIIQRDLPEQWAMTFHIQHTKEHGYTSTEFHQDGGPLTFIPLKDQNKSAVVWCDRKSDIDQAKASEQDDLIMALSLLCDRFWGEMSLVSDPVIWPVSAYTVDQQSVGRALLIGDAAHALPPLGAQGFNTTLEDIFTLKKHLKDQAYHGLDIGEPSGLQHYAHCRKKDIMARVNVTWGINRLLLTGDTTASILHKTMQAVDYLPRLRDMIMSFGMGLENNAHKKRAKG